LNVYSNFNKIKHILLYQRRLNDIREYIIIKIISKDSFGQDIFTKNPKINGKIVLSK
jgi:hypothetical protein